MSISGGQGAWDGRDNAAWSMGALFFSSAALL
eukprot:CAMPEP_0183299688 /NCGR_PEP_ID=MMETSP0160_2-20130417/6358_1 /TAXON_ID=2839 ORGANISM="Odontella Sinensis, Strain Grunow 1884" /NCGR_SAMPLE_ID=MMETSP0160_2 /ASSEMBLY_ACC=CAM_ASM_000250 /LENGTH=31 /DNA_ID= /DNA_START= /DNA_END= /DNA_ORIENTATION=